MKIFHDSRSEKYLIFFKKSVKTFIMKIAFISCNFPAFEYTYNCKEKERTQHEDKKQHYDSRHGNNQ